MLNKAIAFDLYYPLSFLFLILSFFSFFLNQEKKLNYLKFLFLFLIFIFLLYSSLSSLNLYFLWKSNSLSKYLLPPYQNFSYFLGYILFTFYRDFLWRLLGFLLVLSVIQFIIFFLKRDPFYDEEKYYIFISCFFFSFPYNFFFIFLSFFILLLMAILSKIFEKKDNYFSFKNYWLILSLILLILEPYLYSRFFILVQFKP